jgi:hypothetical protein
MDRPHPNPSPKGEGLDSHDIKSPLGRRDFVGQCIFYMQLLLFQPVDQIIIGKEAAIFTLDFLFKFSML